MLRKIRPSIKYRSGCELRLTTWKRCTCQKLCAECSPGKNIGPGVDRVCRVHLLRRVGERVREVTSEKDWPTYNGDPGGNRYTSLTQIDKTTIIVTLGGVESVKTGTMRDDALLHISLC